MRRAGAGHRPLRRARSRPTPTGDWTFEVEAWSDPIATWQHDAGIKIPAGLDVELMFDGGRAAVRAGRRRRCPRATGAATSLPDAARRRCATTGARPRPGSRRRWPRAWSARCSPRTRCASWSPLEGPYPLLRRPASGRCSAPGTSSSRAPRARPSTPRPAAGGRGTFRTAAERLDAVAAMGFDVVYLPPIHPIGEVNRKGPNNTLDPGPDDPGRRGRSARTDGGHDAIHPDLGTFDDFDAFVAARPRARPRGRARPRPAVRRPTTRGSPSTRSGSPPAPTARSPTPRTRRRSTRTSTRSTSTTTRRASAREVLRVVRLLDGARRADLPRRQPAHQAGGVLGVAARARSARTDPDVLFLAEAFTRPAMMQHARRKVGFHQSYTYFTWRNAKWELEEYLARAVRRDRRTCMRPNFFVNTPDILHAYLQYGGPPAFKIRAVLAATAVADAGASTPATSCTSTSRCGPGSEEYLDSEKYQIRPARLGRPRSAEGRTLAPYLTRLNEIRRAHPALQQLRNLTVHRSRRRRRPRASASATRRRRRHRASSSSTSTRTAPARPRSHLDMPALGLDWHDSLRRPRRDHRRDLAAGASTTTCASTPATSPRTSSPCGAVTATATVDRA